MARARLVEGVELLRQKQFAQALTKFDEAYALVPSPNIFYDRGLAYQGLGRDADALEAFDAFLAHADHAPPGTHEKATHEREMLRARVATLAVASDPPGAEISVDGRRRGVTPLSGALYIDVGSARGRGAQAQHRHGDDGADRGCAAGDGASDVAFRRGGSAGVVVEAGGGRAARGRAEPGARAGRRAPLARTRSSRARSRASTSRRWHSRGSAPRSWRRRRRSRSSGRKQSDSVMQDVADGAPFDFGKDSAGRRDNTLAEVFLAAGAAAVTTSAVLFGIRESRQHAERANATRARSQARVTMDGGASAAPGFAGARLRLTF